MHKSGGGESRMFVRMTQLVLLAVLACVLFWRFRVGLTRFFDVDEFTYLHWAAQVSRGDVLYKDIYTYFTPGFFWLLAPLYWIFGVSPTVFVVGRVVALAIFLGLTSGISVLFWQTRSGRWMLLPAVIFAFLPIPYDKILEIRPDNLAVLLSVWALVCQVQGMRRGEASERSWFFVSGLLYALSLFVLVKVLPFASVGALFLAMFVHWNWRRCGPFVLGLVLPWFIFWGITVLKGNFDAAWYALTKLVFESARGAVYTPMGSDLFFYPNAAFYGSDGKTINANLVVNHAVWLVGIFMGLHRLLSGFASGRRRIIDTFIAVIFFVSTWIFVEFFPLKHSQYLIPISVFIAYYSADACAVACDWLAFRVGYLASIALLGAVACVFVRTTVDINSRKIEQSMEYQLAQVRQLLTDIPTSTPVVDLEGRMVFWAQGYPVCCLPFDLFLEFVSRPVPPLYEYLEKYPAQYIFQGDTGRFGNLKPQNLRYLQNHYEPVPGWGERLWRRKI